MGVRDHVRAYSVACTCLLGELDLLELRLEVREIAVVLQVVVVVRRQLLLEPLELVHERRAHRLQALQPLLLAVELGLLLVDLALQVGGRRSGGEEEEVVEEAVEVVAVVVVEGGVVAAVVVAVEVEALVAAAAAVSVTCRLASSCWTLPSICSICAVCSETAPSISRSWRPMSSMS